MSDHEFNSRLVRTVVTVTAVGISLAVLWAARDVLMLIYISALIAMGFSPVVQSIERSGIVAGRSRMPRVLAILVIYLVIVTVFVFLGLLVIPPLVAQAVELWTRLPAEFDAVQRFLIRYHLLARRVTLEEAVQNAPAGSGGSAVSSALVAISTAVGGLFSLITVVILSFYFLIEAQPLFDYTIRFVPASRRTQVSSAAREAVTKVSAWLRAQLVLAGVMGVCAAVGLGLLGEPYFYVIALVAALGETIPIVGPIIGGLTAVAVALTASTTLAVEVGILFLVLHQLEANVLVPKIMERQLGVSPVTVMVALLIGGSLWGLMGAVLAIPTAAILAVIVDQFATAADKPRNA